MPDTMSEFEKLEYGRLVAETLKDRELQFRLFWQSITVTAVIFSFCASIFKEADFWLTFPFVILAPHLILIPTSKIILNRTKTANRKSGYLLTAYNRFAGAFNWERDLAGLRKQKIGGGGTTKENRHPYRPKTIGNMLVSITSLEIICILTFLTFLAAKPYDKVDDFWWIEVILGLIYAIFYVHVIASRARDFFCIRYQESIQGYATRWIDFLKLDGKSLNEIGRWDAPAWKDVLREERNEGYMRFFWKIFWSKQTKLGEKGRQFFEKFCNRVKIFRKLSNKVKNDDNSEFTASRFKPTLVILILWPALLITIHVLSIYFPVNKILAEK